MCEFFVFRGDGLCDDGNNIPECDWDDGDCCGCHVEKGHCEDCKCYDENGLGNSSIRTLIYFDTFCLFQ